MARITVEDCLEQENNRFALVQLAAKRTKQILGGAKALVASSNKAVVTALREIADAKVRFMTEEETAVAREREAQESEAALLENTTVIAAPAPNIEQLLASSDDDDDADDEDIEEIEDEEDDDDDEDGDKDKDKDKEKKDKEEEPTDPELNGNHE
jgi:DNA-directed RNA polymerase subunit omega